MSEREAAASASRATRIAYNFAILRVVPHVDTGAFFNIGVLLHARTAEFLDLHVLSDNDALRAIMPNLDIDLLCRYLASFEAICRGDANAGIIALLPTSERFHWLTAPRSDVLQCSPVHEGLCDDPRRELDQLYARYVSKHLPQEV